MTKKNEYVCVRVQCSVPCELKTAEAPTCCISDGKDDALWVQTNVDYPEQNPKRAEKISDKGARKK